MSLLYIDGFDSYATADLAARGWTVGGNATAIEAGGRFGSRLRLSGGSASPPTARKVVPASGSTCVIGFAWYPGTFYAARPYIVEVLSGATAQFSLAFNASHQLVLYRGDYATALATSVRALWPGVWVYIELKVFIHPTAGTYEVRVNEEPWIGPTTDANTRGASDANWTTVSLDGPWDPGPPYSAFDDLYICDAAGSYNNDFLGDCRVDSHFPTADGATHSFTPSSGSDHWEMVNDATPNGDTDYNASGVAGSKDTLVYQDLKNAGGVIKGVQVCLIAKKGDAGTCTLCPVIRHGGLDNEGVVAGLPTSYIGVIQTYDRNPNGGAPIAWSESDFNAAEFGYKKVV